MQFRTATLAIGGVSAAVAMAGYLVARAEAQPAGPVGDFTNAATAEVHDAQGLPLLRGQFVNSDDDDDDVERKATLAPAGNDSDATGEAEMEFSKRTPAVQEIEFSVRSVQAGTEVVFLLDGQAIGRATADNRGRAELEIDVRMPVAAPRP